MIFHGLEPDWIEAEMDDDPEFIRDVIGQRIRTMIREEVSLVIVEHIALSILIKNILSSNLFCISFSIIFSSVEFLEMLES